MFPFLNFFVLKGLEPSVETMALLTANADSLHKGLSSSIPLINKKVEH